MTSEPARAVPTRLVDLTEFSLSDLGSDDSTDVARVTAALVEEISAPPTVTVGGSDS